MLALLLGIIKLIASTSGTTYKFMLKLDNFVCIFPSVAMHGHFCYNNRELLLLTTIISSVFGPSVVRPLIIFYIRDGTNLSEPLSSVRKQKLHLFVPCRAGCVLGLPYTLLGLSHGQSSTLPISKILTRQASPRPKWAPNQPFHVNLFIKKIVPHRFVTINPTSLNM